MSKRKQVATASEENKHVKKPRFSGKSEEQTSSSSSSSSSSSCADVAPLPSAAAQLVQAQAEIKQMKRLHAAEQKRNEQRISQLTSDKTELARRNQELERKVATLRRCF